MQLGIDNWSFSKSASVTPCNVLIILASVLAEWTFSYTCSHTGKNFMPLDSRFCGKKYMYDELNLQSLFQPWEVMFSIQMWFNM